MGSRSPMQRGNLRGKGVAHRKTATRLRYCLGHTGWPKKFGTITSYALTLPNINGFSQLFHYQNQEKICNNTITKDPTTPQVCCYMTL